MKTKEAIGFCINCRFGSFLDKDKPCRDCVFIPSQFLSKEEITDADMPMGKKDRKELIAYKKMWAVLHFNLFNTPDPKQIMNELYKKHFPKEVINK
jgi:hypothetical protein